MQKDKKELIKRLVAVFAAVSIIAYLAYNTYKINRDPLVTETAVIYEETVAVKTKAVIVRDESYISNGASGVLVPIADDGKRVAKGDEVALVFQNELGAQNYSTARQIEKEIEYYTLLKNKSQVSSVDAVMLDAEIKKSVQNCIAAARSGNFEELTQKGRDVAEAITGRQLALGTEINFDQKLGELNAQLAALKSSGSASQVISAPVSGYYISAVDGYENVLDYRAITALTPEAVEAALASQPQPVQNVMGKIVGEFAWYIVCSVPTQEITDFQTDSAIKVKIPGSAVDEVKAVVYKIIDGENGKSVLVLRASEMNSDIANLRFEDIEAVKKEYSGFRVPNEAIRTQKNEDGSMENGVYVLSGNKIRFRKINVLYSAQDYCIAENTGQTGYLKLYDEIVIEGKDLYDGKVIE